MTKHTNHSQAKTACTEERIAITDADLPLSCPPRDKRIWDAHPRVYLSLEDNGTVVCPYCGTTYVHSGTNASTH